MNEALHLSTEERDIFMDCLHKIRRELTQTNGRLTNTLITNNIELLLNYCMRFYERQFAARRTANADILVMFESLLDRYVEDGRLRNDGIPTVRWCAGELHLSPNYLGDLMKRETGKTAKEHIERKIIECAKEQIMSPHKSISEIAYDLGFQYPQHLSRLFRKIFGMTPVEFRQSIGK